MTHAFKTKKGALLSDVDIRDLCLRSKGSMIQPFVSESKGRISYGLSSFSYDARLGTQFKKPSKYIELIDPLQGCKEDFIHVGMVDLDVIDIPAHGFLLAQTKEYFKIPKDVLGLCIGKSTYARCGLVTNTTSLQPGWEGYVTLELSNTTDVPIRLYIGEGICQFLFFYGGVCGSSYSGLYQNQLGVGVPKGRKDNEDD